MLAPQQENLRSTSSTYHEKYRFGSPRSRSRDRCHRAAYAEAAGKWAPLAYTPMGDYGQSLIDMAAAKHPELKIITLHVTPPKVSPELDRERRLLFSNIGRIGKVDSEADSDAYRAGREVINVVKEASPASTNFSITASPKYQVLVPLNDKFGNKVGLLVMVFPYHENFDMETYHKIAQEVTAEMSSRTTSKDDLFKPVSK